MGIVGFNLCSRNELIPRSGADPIPLGTTHPHSGLFEKKRGVRRGLKVGQVSMTNQGGGVGECFLCWVRSVGVS